MEHCNPILKNQQSPQKFITIGEVMLRLDPSEGRIRTARSFKAWECAAAKTFLRRCRGKIR